MEDCSSWVSQTQSWQERSDPRRAVANPLVWWCEKKPSDQKAFADIGWTVWIAIIDPDCTPLAGVVTVRAGTHQSHMNTLHATVAALHSAKIPGKGIYHLKGSWSSNPIPYRAACVATHQGQIMNTWSGISPKYAHLKLKANQIPIFHWVNGASGVTQTFRFRYYLEGERNKFRSPPNEAKSCLWWLIKPSSSPKVF